MANTPDQLEAKFKHAKFDKVKTMSRIVLTVQGNSQRVTPVKTGTLKRSETTRVEAGGNRGIVGTNVSYARFVHDGTIKMKARPFFEEGLAASRDSIVKMLNDAGHEMLSKIK
jgi:HK97 gp10 family phage protein